MTAVDPASPSNRVGRGPVTMTLGDIAELIRAISVGDSPIREDTLLVSLGLIDDAGKLTATGRQLEEAHWIYQDAQRVRVIWRDALLRLPETQALMQVLHGRGAIPVAGAHYSMARHGFVGAGDAPHMRAFLQVLNNAGVVAYSKRDQTVRVVAPLPEELAASVRVVEPERPYSNVLALREILRACEGYYPLGGATLAGEGPGTAQLRGGRDKDQ